MKVFKKDGTLTKRAEEHVRTWGDDKADGESFKVLFRMRDERQVGRTQQQTLWFRFLPDGAIHYRRSRTHTKYGYNEVWAMCAKHPQGDTL